MKGNKQSGFTLTELLVAVGVASIIGAVLVGSYRLGFLRESRLSSDARSLVSALNYARVRALEDKGYARVSQASLEMPIGPPEANVQKYGKVRFELEAEKEADLSFVDTDFVAFSGMHTAPFDAICDVPLRIHPGFRLRLCPCPGFHSSR